MMKKNVWWIGLFLLFLIGCNSNADAQETLSINPLEGDDPLVEEERAEDKGDKMQLTLDGASYPFTTKDYPILSQYVHNFDRPEEQLGNLPFSKINEDQYLVEFACHEQRCSHLMIDFEQKHSFLISDLSKLVSNHVSPDQQYVAFLFERTYEEEVTHQLVVMDLGTLEPVDLEPGEDHLLPKPNQYQYAIHSVTFMDEERLKITNDDPVAGADTHDPVRTQWIYK
ncbi:hypothetical protein LC065_16845 [Halobacillus litoralis]|uniref:hypothetical protein n=1 Tax=Halobacillus litoralis TaxID=45668 RepID=UPI001CFE7C97|nr:hypothetical protein [Halobacillus litoralis]WLR47169.1 hypothetical protein LC065_16845 [Halobacillus litoralis]